MGHEIRYEVRLTAEEIDYLHGMVCDDIGEFNRSIENKNKQRSVFTETALDNLRAKLDFDDKTEEEDK